ncbi:MAG: hypothetical protein AVDCRST_MAG18-369 [uncultured Thermomicrobiales bacterium]|uniref:Terpene synthase n=1 Tax=uncultured Thermomicrobiales bacterium TaxID=1645740 RepID=A0A6J4UK45_9BACT|nr:MAG: hypothetical protein AVDCRST_MAG18-369 [uncultured Thermomicrobiales bacterium]
MVTMSRSEVHIQERTPARAPREEFDHPTPAPRGDDVTLGHLLAAFQLPSLAAHSAQITADLEDWRATFPLADARRFGALALTAAVHLPHLSRRERALAARLNGWVYAFDDLVDEVSGGRITTLGALAGGRLPDAALDPLAARCAAVFTGIPATPGADDPGGIIAALGDLVGEVRARPCPPTLAAFWRDSFHRMLTGIIRERRLATELAEGAPPPSPAAHLETARYSIGAPYYLASCFILHAGADDPDLVRRLPALIALSLAAADIARLANDLRTWVREEREGTYNSIRAADAALARLIPTLPATARRAQAVLAVERLLATRRERVAGLLAAAPTPCPDAEAGIGRLVELIPALYAAADFHEFGSAPPVGSAVARD